MKNYYKILNVRPQASGQEIKKAYRKLSLFWHPDKNTSQDAPFRMQEINEAYKLLSDPEQRKLLDEALKPKQVNNYGYGYEPVKQEKSISLFSLLEKIMDFLSYPFSVLGILIFLAIGISGLMLIKKILLKGRFDAVSILLILIMLSVAAFCFWIAYLQIRSLWEKIFDKE